VGGIFLVGKEKLLGREQKTPGGGKNPTPGGGTPGKNKKEKKQVPPPAWKNETHQHKSQHTRGEKLQIRKPRETLRPSRVLQNTGEGTAYAKRGRGGVKSLNARRLDKESGEKRRP